MEKNSYRRVFCLVMTLCIIAFLSPDTRTAGFFAPLKVCARTNEPAGNAGKKKIADVWMVDGKPVQVTEDPSDVALLMDTALPYHTGTVSIDTKTGQVETEEGDSTTMEKVFPVSKDERKKLFKADRRKNRKQIETYLQDEELYSIDDSKEDVVTVSFPYAYKRLVVFAGIGSLKNSFGASRISYFVPARHYILEYPTEEATREAQLLLEDELGEESVIPDLPIKACSDAFTEKNSVYQSWGTDMMRLNVVRDRINEDADMTDTITVAVLDSGINAEHEMFAGRLADGAKSLIVDSTPTGKSITMDDLYFHGSFVAGIIADATPKQVRILPIKIMDQEGNSNFATLIDGLTYAMERAEIINMSLGASLSNMEEGTGAYRMYQKVEALLKTAKDKNCICVVAAGNRKGDENLDIAVNKMYPAMSDYVLTVSSIDIEKKIANNSHYGDCVDFAAPGVSIKSAARDGVSEYTVESGTSMATPHVSAACAVTKLYNKDAPNDTITKYLAGLAEDLGDTGKDKYYGHGLIVFQNGTVEKLEYDETPSGDPDEDNNGSGSGSGSSGNTSDRSGESVSSAGFKKGSSLKVSGSSYKVTKMAKGSDPGTVTLTRAKNIKNVTIPATVKLGDKKNYKVTAVGAKAFTAGKIRTVTIGSKVSKITAKAFYKSKAATVILKTKALKKSTVKDSLTGSKVKTVKIKLGSNKLNKKYRNIYKKIFTKKNVGKKVNIK